MVTVVLRVWLSDEPGSLATVAGCIGAAGGDLVGIDVLERGAGRVIDEFLVEIDDPARLDALVNAVHDLDGVDVELADLAVEGVPDARLDALNLAGALVAAPDPSALVEVLVVECQRAFGASWAVVLDADTPRFLAVAGGAPAANWLAAYVHGVRSADSAAAPVDVAVAPLGDAGLLLLLGRESVRFRDRERRQLEALAAIGARRLGEHAHSVVAAAWRPPRRA